MAFSPAWPNGGLPRSCISEAAETMAPKSMGEMPDALSCLSFCNTRSPASFPSDRPTLATSRLCVKSGMHKIMLRQWKYLRFVLQHAKGVAENNAVVILLKFASLIAVFFLFFSCSPVAKQLNPIHLILFFSFLLFVQSAIACANEIPRPH
jgi:hypothetical protein